MNTAIKDGGSAFPGGIQAAPSAHDDCPPTQQGMTLRDYFAGQAVAGLCAHPVFSDNAAGWLAEVSYGVADAMIEAREPK